MIRVVVIDDHPLFAEGTVEVLDRMPSIRAVGYSVTLDDGVKKIAQLRPDVVLCDVMLGDDPIGFTLPSRLKAEVGQTPAVIFLSQFADGALYQKAIAAGGAGYLRKTVDPEALRAAIVAVAGGSSVFPRAAIAGEADEPRTPSPREVEVLRLLADGRSNTEIAAELGIGESTVETHLGRLRLRYGLATRTQLAILADRQGWLGPRAQKKAQKPA